MTDEDKFEKLEDIPVDKEMEMSPVSDDFQPTEDAGFELKSILLMQAFCVVNVASQAVVKVASEYDVHAFDYSIVRTFINLLTSSTMLVMSGQSLVVPKEKRCTLTFRVILGFSAFTAMVAAVQILPLSFYSIIFNTCPFWAAIIGWFLLGEAVTKITLFCIGCSFVGIFLLLTGESNKNTEMEIDLWAGGYMFGYALSFYCAVGFATIGVLTRSLKDLHFAQVAFYYGLGSFLMSLAILIIEFMLSDREVPRIFTYVPEAYKYMAIAGFLSATSILLSTKAMQGAKTAFLQLLTYMGTVYSFLLDVFAFGIVFNIQEMVGASIVLIFCIVAVAQKFANN